jgi:glycerol-3-phosphate dehydrogenase
MQTGISSTVDLLVIGGGINGTGIARDAAGRDLKVLLVEKGDLAGATSSASSKLIHGGLRYLEHYEFRLVREALAEREVLLRAAPHLISPLRFVLPHMSDLRPAWMIRAGLFLYDRLGGVSALPRSESVDFASSPYGRGLKPELRRGFVYSDGWVDDARLVVANARAAADLGADIRVRTPLLSARRNGPVWRATLGHADGGRSEVMARALINAAGPWAHDVITHTVGLNTPHGLRLIKGSHIIVKRQYEGDHAFILQHTDRRVIFVIPYERDYTLIGTTDVPFDADPGDAAISPDETAYLCLAATRYLAKPVFPDDVVWSYAGVRPLYDDGSSAASEITRDYVLELDGGGDRAPVLSIFGGKLTTYRKLAEQAIERIAPFFPGLRPRWTSGVQLPGGDFADDKSGAFLAGLARAHPWLPAELREALLRRHGSLIGSVLGDARSLADLGTHFGAGLYAREVDYFIAHEWASSADDVLFRRTKAGLHLTVAQRDTVAAYLSGTRLRGHG